jgi:hypothetical protein
MNNSISVRILNDQAERLEQIKERLEQENERIFTDTEYQLERARMLGMMEMAKVFDVNIEDYRWVYAC